MVFFKRQHSSCGPKELYEAVAAPSFVAHVQPYTGYAWRHEMEQRQKKPQTIGRPCRRFFPTSDEDDDVDDGDYEDFNEDEV